MKTTTALGCEPIGLAAWEWGGDAQMWASPFHSLTPSPYGVRLVPTGRPVITHSTPDPKPHPESLERCFEWLASADAHNSARRFLARAGFTYVKPEDAIADTRQAIWMEFTANPSKEITSVNGYCFQALRHCVANLGRGRAQQDEIFIREEWKPETAEKRRAPRDPSPRTSDEIDLVDRTLIHLELSGADPRSVSAALSYVTLTQFVDIDCHGLPSPHAGAKPAQARWWPCLWLAHHDPSMFPDLLGGSAAQRKRLQHARDRAERVLQLGTSQRREIS